MDSSGDEFDNATTATVLEPSAREKQGSVMCWSRWRPRQDGYAGAFDYGIGREDGAQIADYLHVFEEVLASDGNPD